MHPDRSQLTTPTPEHTVEHEPTDSSTAAATNSARTAATTTNGPPSHPTRNPHSDTARWHGLTSTETA